MAEKRYPDGLRLWPAREGAPAFVRGAITIDKAKFSEWLEQEPTNEKGYVRLDVLRSQKEESGLYLVVNDYGVQRDQSHDYPETPYAQTSEPVADANGDDLPF